MKFTSRLLMALALLAAGCAAPKPTARSPFRLVEGKRIGSLELAEDEAGRSKESKDSVAFDKAHLHPKPRIGFKYPGETFTEMKVYDGDKLLKACDEGSFVRKEATPGGMGGNWMPGADGKMVYAATFTPGEKEEYKVKYNLECEVEAVKDGMTVELLSGEELISRYRVVQPE